MAKQAIRTAQSEKWLFMDVGNTALTFQALHGSGLSAHFSIPNNDIPKLIYKLSKKGLIDSDTLIAIASVVPQISRFLTNEFRKTAVKTVLLAGENFPVKIRHKYNNYSKLGIDRKINAAGAIFLYGGPCAVFDFGTALTVDCISAQNVFEGGFIIPGPQIAFQALANKTALLPIGLKIPDKTRGFLGRNTSDCMKNGILVGYGAMATDLIRQLRQRYGKKLKTIATGGFASKIRPYAPGFDLIDPQHTLRSLALLALQHTNK